MLAKRSGPFRTWILAITMIAICVDCLAQELPAQKPRTPDPQAEPQSPSEQQPSQKYPEQAPTQTQTPAGAEAGSAPQSSQTFRGTIIKLHNQFALQDSAGSLTYLLDDQERAREYEGKAVKVIGTLETARNLIHVSSIEPMS